MSTQSKWTEEDEAFWQEFRNEEVESSANADRLIAAAPDLLDALQRLTHPMADDTDVEYALAAIAKATGSN